MIVNAIRIFVRVEPCFLDLPLTPDEELALDRAAASSRPYVE